jgi:hypothetical protein
VEGQEITSEDFDFPAEVKSNGDLEIANEQMATQKAFMRLNVLMNPTLSDVVNSEDRYNALKDWLEKDGVKDPDMFCTDPKIIAQEKIGQMQQQIAGMQQQMDGMREESKQNLKAMQKDKRRKQVAEEQTNAEKEMADELQMKNAEGIGEQIGNELFSK